MFRHMIQLPFAILLLCGSATAPICGEEPFTSSAKITNAALVYWQAFAFLPELNKEDTELLGQIEKGEKPLEDARPLLGRSSLALNLTRNVKPQTPCRWQLIEDGPGTLLPHLGKARLLARLMVLQARTDAKAGNDEAAVDHLTRALLVARNVDEGVLVQMLVGDAIESLVVDAAEKLLAGLDGGSANRFAESLAKLPPRTTLSQAMTYERDVFGAWMRPIMTAEVERARATLKQLGVDDGSAELKAILAGTKEQRLQRFEEFLAEYDKMIEASILPLPKAKQEFKRLEAAVKESPNPLIRLLIPAGGHANERHAETSERFAKFETAVRDAAESASTLN